jgi:hypothetical protein
MQTAANNCGKPKRERPCCEGPGLFRSCCPNVAATYRVVAQRCPGALARALESPMFVRLKGGDIPQPSRMGNIGWLPIVASVCSMLPPRHKRDISATAPQSGTIMTVTSETGRFWKQILGGVTRPPFGAGDTRTCTATTTVTLLWSVARATATCQVRGTCCP